MTAQNVDINNQKHNRGRRTYVDSLEINLLLEHRLFWGLPQFDAKGDVRTLNDITPVAPDHDFIIAFFL